MPTSQIKTLLQAAWVKIAIGVIAVFILVLILIPLLVNGETFKPTLESRLSAALNRKVTIGHLSFSLFSGSLVADTVSIADDTNFSSSAFLQAKELRVGVETGSLLFHHEVHITSLTIDTPAIQLIQNQAGKWNFSSIGNTAPRTPQQQSSSTPDLTVRALQIKNGSATVASVPPAARPFVYSNIDLNVKQFSFASNFPFDLTANLPANGSLKLNGTAGPISQKDASTTPVHANIQIAHLDPVAAGLVDSSKGVSTVADCDAQISSDGATLSSTGKIKADHLQLARTGSPAPHPIELDYNISNDLNMRAGHVADIAIHAGPATAHVNGTFRFTPQAIVLDLHLAAPGLPVDQLVELLPAFGVKVPAGSSLHGGTLTANLAITGPATETTIAGPVEVDNTKLVGFDLGSKIQGLSALTGTAGGTDIQTLRATINSSPQTTQIASIYGNLPQLGTATGSGTVAPSGALDFKMVATLSSNNAVGAVANQAVNQVSGVIGGFLHPNAKPSSSTTAHGIPLLISGTATSPSIRANVGALLH
ncbi:MAG TPA: AsmA family protein [Terracidiphilus sp.]|jgi:AsmA protein